MCLEDNLQIRPFSGGCAAGAKKLEKKQGKHENKSFRKIKKVDLLV